MIASVGAVGIVSFSGLFALGATSAAAAGAPPASRGSEQELNIFWSAFQKAVKIRDKAAIARLTRFPFVVRWGNSDPEDPRFEYDRVRFLGALDRLLQLAPNGELANADGTRVAGGGDTMIEAVGRTPHPPEIDPGIATVECFEFRFIGKTWRCTAAFSTDPELLGAQESYPVPRVSPLRKYLLDVTSEALKLRRPLVVRHLRTTGQIAYLEAEEPGRDGRLARALIRRTGTDPFGRMVWKVDRSSLSPPADNHEDARDLAPFAGPGIPSSLFPSNREIIGEGTRHAR